MKNFIKALIISLVATFTLTLNASPKIAITNYPWKKLSLKAMLEDIKDSDVKYIFAFHGMPIGGNGPHANDSFSHTMSKSAQIEMQTMLDSYDKKIIGIGHIKHSEAEEIEAVFKFCKDTGIEIMTIEAPLKALKTYDEMAIKYGVAGGLYNHPDKAPYASPKKALEGIQGLEKIKVFADIGQWGRTNLDILKCLEEVSAKNIMAVSLQDLTPATGKKKAGCEEFGKGTLPLKEFVTTLNATGFNGYYLIMFANTKDAKDRSQIEKVLPSVKYLKNIIEN